MAVADYPPFNDDPELLYQTMQIFATALARRQAMEAAGIPIPPSAYCRCKVPRPAELEAYDDQP